MASVLDRVLRRPASWAPPMSHLKVGLPPIFRVKGELRTVANVPPLTKEAVEEFGQTMMNARLRDLFDKNWDVDLALCHGRRLPLPGQYPAAAGIHGLWSCASSRPTFRPSRRLNLPTQGFGTGR